MPEAAPAHLTKYYEAAAQEGPCGPDEAICVLTTDRKDRDGEVVLPSGARLNNFRSNPVVQYGHAKGLPSEGEAGLPVARNLWIKATRDGHGLVGKHAFDLKDPFSARVCNKVKGDFLRTHSITFNPIKFGPPTAEELKARPDWQGVKTIYREWELVEYSVVAFPSNVDAVTLAKSPKGPPMPETETHDPAAIEPVVTPEAAPEHEPADAPAPEAEAEPVAKAAAPEPDEDDDGDGDEDDAPEPLKRGDHVKLKAPHCKGCGVVQSVHKGEMVPEVEEDLYGSAAEPAARVKMCKRMGGGCAPTAVHKAVFVKHAEKCEPVKAAKKKSAEPAPPAGWTDRERAAYLASRLAAPDITDLIAARVVNGIEVQVKGKV